MRRYTSEAIGSFAIVFVGCGTALMGGSTVGPLGVALAFGLSFALMHLALAPLSGGHCNPALSVSAWITGKLPGRDLVPYMAAQVAGGVLGAALSIYVATHRPGGTPQAAQIISNGYDRLSPGYYGLSSAVAAEVVLTAILVFVFLGSAREVIPGGVEREGRVVFPKVSSGGISALAAGGAYTLIHLVGGPVTKLGANPARSLGPALFAGGMALEQVWLFVAAPMVGALIAGICHRALYGVGVYGESKKGAGAAAKEAEG